MSHNLKSNLVWFWYIPALFFAFSFGCLTLQKLIFWFHQILGTLTLKVFQHMPQVTLAVKQKQKGVYHLTYNELNTRHDACYSIFSRRPRACFGFQNLCVSALQRYVFDLSQIFNQSAPAIQGNLFWKFSLFEFFKLQNFVIFNDAQCFIKIVAGDS